MILILIKRFLGWGRATRGLGGRWFLIGGNVDVRSKLWNDTLTDKRGECVEEVIMSCNLHCCNMGSEPTFMTAMGSAILDVMLASIEAAGNVHEWAVDTTSVIDSDHRLITFVYDWRVQKVEESIFGEKFQVRQADWEAFRLKLAEELFNGRSSWQDEDLHTRADHLTQSLTKACLASMPKVKPRNLRKSVWFTRGVAES